MTRKEYPGGTVTITMSYDQAMALRRSIVRYLSRPESPLLPPEEESLLLACYDAISEVTDFTVFNPESFRRADGEEPVKGP